MSRIRSPNYPSLSLPAAIERVKVIRAAEGRNAVPRDVMAKHLGFGSINGASATVLSALAKYGLIEAANDGEARVSELAVRILYPDGDEDRKAALLEAAYRPTLFAEIRDKWPDRPPSDESLRAFLVRKGFSASALDQVIQFYRETIEVAGATSRGHDSPPTPVTREATPMTSAPLASSPGLSAPPALASGKPFAVAFDGTVLTGTMAIRSVRDIDKLMKVLQAQKAAFEAMQDDEDEFEPGPDDQRDALRTSADGDSLS